MTSPTRKITTDEVISYILNTSDINTLRSMRGSIDARIDMLATIQGSTLKAGDRVYFENKRSRKLPIGKVYGIVEKVNISKAKIRIDRAISLYDIWDVPFTMITKA